MKLPDIDMDLVAIAAVIVTFMFCSMRLLYGYWPWQLHPRLKRQREKVVADLAQGNFDFQPVTQPAQTASRVNNMPSGDQPVPEENK
jgi:hypothetical protein